MEVDYKAIGQRIKIARIKKGVTQETVADDFKRWDKFKTFVAVAFHFFNDVSIIVYGGVGVEKIGYEGEDLEEYYTNLLSEVKSNETA